MRAVIYCRCSTEEEAQIDALKKQVEEAKTAVREKGWTLADTYVESKSGTTTKGRAEYARLFADLLTDRFDVIVIKSQDRLMRNTRDWYLFLDRMQGNGKKLYLYLERKFFTTEDSLITGIKAILAEEYSRELSKKIVNAHKNRQKNGTRAVMTNRTFGYRKLPDGSVVVDEEHRDDVVRIFQYVEQYGCRTAAAILASEHVQSKLGNPMTPNAIRRIVHNPMYRGICVMNKQHFDFNTKKTIKNPESEWIYVEGLVPAIVDADLWHRANHAIAKRASAGNTAGSGPRGSNPRGSNPRGSNPGKDSLSKKLVCGVCGRPYYRTCRRICSNPDRVVKEWKCSGYIQHGRAESHRRDTIRKVMTEEQKGCDNIHLEEDTVFAVLEQVNEVYFQSGQMDKTDIINKTMLLLENSLLQDDIELKLGKLEKEHKELSRKKQMLVDKLLDEVISDLEYREQSRRFTKFLEENEEKQRNLRQEAGEQKMLTERLESIRRRLDQGGFEKAAANRMLKDVKEILVHEWQLEIRFHHATASVWADYPFSPNTEKGRYLDQLKIMEYLKADPGTSAKNIALQMERSPYMIWNRITELKKNGYIRFYGSGGKGTWEILRELPDRKSLQNGDSAL